MVECLTRNRGAAGSSLTGVTALCPRARHINPSLVLVQPRKTGPYITEGLLIGRKDSNQTKQSVISERFQTSLNKDTRAVSNICHGPRWSSRNHSHIVLQVCDTARV